MILHSLKAKQKVLKGILRWNNLFIVFGVFCDFPKNTIFVVGEFVQSELMSFARYDTEHPSIKVNNQFSSCLYKYSKENSH